MTKKLPRYTTVMRTSTYDTALSIIHVFVSFGRYGKLAIEGRRRKSWHATLSEHLVGYNLQTAILVLLHSARSIGFAFRTAPHSGPHFSLRVLAAKKHLRGHARMVHVVVVADAFYILALKAFVDFTSLHDFLPRLRALLPRFRRESLLYPLRFCIARLLETSEGFALAGVGRCHSE